jgi:molecular chaperone GrpE (heat shock protein)
MAPVLEALDRFHERLDRHLQDTAACSRTAFDRLYDEMRQYKDNFVMEVQRGLLTDLMMLYDSIDRLRRHYETAGEADVSDLTENLAGLLVEAEEILARRGIDPFEAMSETLDRRTQKAMRSVPTSVAEEDLLVVERLKRGFMLGDKPFRKEQVVIKKYSPQAASSEKREATES